MKLSPRAFAQDKTNKKTYKLLKKHMLTLKVCFNRQFLLTLNKKIFIFIKICNKPDF